MLITRGTIRRLLPTAAVAAILAMPVAAGAQAAAPATPVAASAQAVVRAIIVDGKSVTQTDRVHRSRFADLTEEATIAVNTPLEAGDLIRALDSTVLVELECASKGRTPFRFSSGFRVVVLPPRQDVPCVMQLLAGGVDVRTEEPTEINAGGIVLGSRGTQYAVQLRRTNEGTVCDGVVFDDELEVKVPAREAMKLASNSGWTYNLVTGTGQRGAVSERTIEWSAAVATLFDLARLAPGTDSSPEAQKQLGQQLFELNKAVLKAPANQEARAELGKTQQRLGIADAARYNLRKAGDLKIRQTTPRGGDVPAVQAAPAAQPQTPAIKGTTVAQSPQRAAGRATEKVAVVPAVRALELVHAGNPAAAIEMLKPRVDSSQAVTRDYYVLAEAYLAAGDRASARRMAEKALAAADAATALSASETETLQALQRGK
jgi:hypothetical protein